MHFVKVGNAVLDDGHQSLAEHLRQLHDCWRRAPDRDDMLAAFESFVALLRSHFETEEVILRGAGYSGMEDHAAKHDAVVQAVADVVSGLRETASLSGYHAASVIADLLYDHELVEDSEYWQSIDQAPTDVGARLGWSPALHTGIAAIDAQHHAMVAGVNALHVMATNEGPQGRAAFLAALRDFRSLAAHHFREEEKLWNGDSSAATAETKVGDEAHAAAHRALLNSFDAMIMRVELGRIAPREVVNDFLPYWMLDHLVRTDLPHLAREKNES